MESSGTIKIDNAEIMLTDKTIYCHSSSGSRKDQSLKKENLLGIKIKAQRDKASDSENWRIGLRSPTESIVHPRPSFNGTQSRDRKTQIYPSIDSSSKQKSKKVSSDILHQTPDSILSFFNDGSIEISSMLDFRMLNPQELINGLMVIRKACTSVKDIVLVTKLVHMLAVSKNHFITSVSLLVGKKLSNTLFTNDDFVLTVLDILGVLVEKMPASSSEFLELLLPQMHEVARQFDNDQKYCEKFQELEKAKEYLATVVLPQDLSETTNDSDFRLVPTIPTTCEMLSHKRPLTYSAVIEGPYRSIEHYLNVQYRLMRGDMFEDYRKCILDYHSHKDLTNGHFYHYAHFENAAMSRRGKILYFSVPLKWEVNWRTTKRLTIGSLICLSNDGFRSFRFASIYSREPDNGSGKVCYLGLHFESDGELENVSVLYEIIEAGGFFESYFYVAGNLKQLDAVTFPLKESLVSFQNCNDPPFLLDDVQENELKKVQCELEDKIQAEAFELVLRNKVALVQGPPGTGKSYLGIQIAHYLLKVVQFKKPIIVMCYTNHALDQFLGKMLDFTSKIIRVGSRSKMERLKAHNLNNIIDSFDNFEGGPMSLRKIYLKMMDCHDDESMTLLRIESNVYFKKKNSTNGDFVTTIQSLNIAHSLVDSYINDLFCYKRNPTYQNAISEYKAVAYELCERAKNIANPFTTAILDNSKQHDIRLADLFDLKNVPAKKDQMNCLFNVIFHASKAIKLHQWLLTDPDFCHVYDEMEEFRKILMEELLYCIQLKHFVRDKATPKQNAKMKSQLEPFSLLLLRLYKISETEIYKTRSTDFTKFEIQEFILNESVSVFKLFLKTAVRWCEINEAIIELENINLWTLNIMSRWKLLSLWMQTIYSSSNVHESIDNITDNIKTMKMFESSRDRNFLSSADIIGITTTGATKHFDLLKFIGPTTYIVEEAAEVFESHITASLVPTIEHLILIGDHVQLRPTPTVYDFAVKYHMDVSLFERLFKNEVPSKCLKVQHRMRPSIAHLLVPEFYTALENHLSVTKFDDVAGMSSNIFFLQHSEEENDEDELKSHSNLHEAKFLLSLSEYLIKQGHPLSSITILTTYTGQLHLLQKYIRRNTAVSKVFATTVDNYQGEENDIILLSFVRSNIENKAGFIKTSNRICVALSRARKGLYCIGNFTMLASQSKIWKSLVIKLSKMDSFGDKLPVNCPKHPEKKIFVKTSSDLDMFTKFGCQELCYNPLLCGHKCDLHCHDKKIQHMGHFCNSECKRFLPCGHVRPMCSDETTDFTCNEFIISDTKCGQKIEYVCGELPNHQNCLSPLLLECGHTIPCTVFTQTSFSVKHYSCLEEITNTLPCGHTVVLLCSEMIKCKNRKCIEPTLVTLLCGHNISIPCNQTADCKLLKCMEPTTKTLQCGHFISGPCNETANNDLCHMLTKMSLKCGHSTLIPCNETSNANSLLLKCTEITTTTLPCGHNFLGPCSETTNKDICKEPTILTLKCGHSISIPCNKTFGMDSLMFKCMEMTKLTLPCGHRFSGPCYETENKDICKESIILTLKCGHNMSVLCNKIFGMDSSMLKCITSMLKCMETITSTLLCGHSSSVPCYKAADNYTCQESTTIVLKCGHPMIAPCNETFNEVPLFLCKVPIATTLPCGHLSNVMCCKTNSLSLIQCKEICKALLNCGHKCCGKCYECSSSGVHAICKVRTEKSLPCGHVALIECDNPFFVCQKRCRHYCIHSQCINPCYAVCVACTKACTWSCKHSHCSRRCSELCDRPPCNESCPKRNPICNHSCPGYCGEPCPTSCPECEEGSEIMVNTKRLVLLEDCGHSVPCDKLTIFLSQSLRDSFPQCPECHVPIFKNTRFGNVLKSYFKTRHNSKLQHPLIDFPIINFFKQSVPYYKYKEHTEKLWKDFEMDKLEPNEYFSTLRVIRKLNVLFCINQFLKTHKIEMNTEKLYDSLLPEKNHRTFSSQFFRLSGEFRNSSSQIFKKAVSLFIEHSIKTKGMFSKIGRINEMCEDIQLYLNVERFEVDESYSFGNNPFGSNATWKILELVESMEGFDCPTLNLFQQFIQDLNKELELTR